MTFGCGIIHSQAPSQETARRQRLTCYILTGTTCLLLIALASLLPANYGTGRADESTRHSAASPVKIPGVIVDVGADVIVVKASKTNYRLNKNTAPLNAAAGDKITLWVTAGHAVIDHDREDIGRRVRFITGTLLGPASTQHIKLWTPEGERVYSVVQHETTIRRLPADTMVTIEVDEAGTVIDVHPVETEMAACDKRHHCKVMLHGTVRKIEGGMIFIQTPVVEYEVPATVAPGDTAPGDEMTLWVNENDVVLNYHRAGEASYRRFVTGPLRYADKARSHIQLWTPEGEKTFSLAQVEKAGHLQEGRPITVEVSEAGAVLDLWQSS